MLSHKVKFAVFKQKRKKKKEKKIFVFLIHFFVFYGLDLELTKISYLSPEIKQWIS